MQPSIPTDPVQANVAAHAGDGYFGCCPQCGLPGQLLHVGREEHCHCRACRTRWKVGENILSTWRHMSEADFDRNRVVLAGCREVEPLYPTAEDREAHHTFQRIMGEEEPSIDPLIFGDEPW